MRPERSWSVVAEAKDGTGFFGAETAALLRSWLQIRQDANPEDYLFTDRQG